MDQVFEENAPKGFPIPYPLIYGRVRVLVLWRCPGALLHEDPFVAVSLVGSSSKNGQWYLGKRPGCPGVHICLPGYCGP